MSAPLPSSPSLSSIGQASPSSDSNNSSDTGVDKNCEVSIIIDADQSHIPETIIDESSVSPTSLSSPKQQQREQTESSTKSDETDINKEQELIANMKEKIASLEEHVESLQCLHDIIATKMAKKDRELSQCESNIRNLQTERDQLKEKNSAWDKTVIALQRDKNQLIADLAQANSKIEVLNDEATSLRLTIADSKSENETLKNNNDKNAEQISKLTAEVASLQQQLTQAKKGYLTRFTEWIVPAYQHLRGHDTEEFKAHVREYDRVQQEKQQKLNKENREYRAEIQRQLDEIDAECEEIRLGGYKFSANNDDENDDDDDDDEKEESDKEYDKSDEDEKEQIGAQEESKKEENDSMMVFNNSQNFNQENRPPCAAASSSSTSSLPPPMPRTTVCTPNTKFETSFNGFTNVQSTPIRPGNRNRQN